MLHQKKRAETTEEKMKSGKGSTHENRFQTDENSVEVPSKEGTTATPKENLSPKGGRKNKKSPPRVSTPTHPDKHTEENGSCDKNLSLRKEGASKKKHAILEKNEKR